MLYLSQQVQFDNSFEAQDGNSNSAPNLKCRDVSSPSSLILIALERWIYLKPKCILEGSSFGLSNISSEPDTESWISVCNQMRIVTLCRLRWVTNETSDYESPIPF
ncbi:hypothetical protein CEXT_433021 [Caerostris extrusa]|uniref:Uncharacterized protein n=1 Tax=Caerostris extrusa TaxID=172846 RepID=A0AAV4SDF6_CAEEX|nr:hypothetical protein CEXT_433021 [Caerostris extrusa]